jgi:hypothetical protein
VKNVGSMKIKNNWILHELNPISLLCHNREHKVSFFTILYDQAINKLTILRIKYGSDEIEIEKFKLPLE